MAINLDKFRRDVDREMKKVGADSMKKLTSSDYRRIGEAAIGEMKVLMSKGISPIQDNGRFPAYKWSGIANNLVKNAKRLKTATGRKSARSSAKSLKEKKYPYSVQGKFPNKKERPVNMYLSGDFWNALKALPRKDGVDIGFTDEGQEKKEQGHREGVNGQPKRPIIPNSREQFSPSIYRRIVDVFRDIVRNKFRT